MSIDDRLNSSELRRTTARALIAEGCKHDEAMTPASDFDSTGLMVHDGANVSGIAWSRTNLRALLDGYAAELDATDKLEAENARLRKALGSSSESLVRLDNS